ncbi:MAG TPA: hypothetical protein DDW50_05730 [Firmicutes bacterium]|jgi:hypothetical protein|nr:hypothetical protein [Bacillota bacterium]
MMYSHDSPKESHYVSVNTLIQHKNKGFNRYPTYEQFMKEQGKKSPPQEKLQSQTILNPQDSKGSAISEKEESSESRDVSSAKNPTAISEVESGGTKTVPQTTGAVESGLQKDFNYQPPEEDIKNTRDENKDEKEPVPLQQKSFTAESGADAGSDPGVDSKLHTIQGGADRLSEGIVAKDEAPAKTEGDWETRTFTNQEDSDFNRDITPEIHFSTQQFTEAAVYDRVSPGVLNPPDQLFVTNEQGLKTNLNPPQEKRTPGLENTAAVSQETEGAEQSQRPLQENKEPSQEEFLQEFEDQSTTKEAQGKAAQLAAGLQGMAEEHKAEITSDAATEKTKIEGFVKKQTGLIQNALNGQKGLIHQIYSANIKTLRATAEKCKTDVKSQVIGEIKQVQSETEIQIARVDKELNQRKNDFHAFMVEQQKHPRLIADSETNRANAELDKASGECLDIGRVEAKKHSRKESQEAAFKVAFESANDIRSKKVDISSNLKTRAKEFAKQYSGYDQKITEQIAEVQRNVIPVFRDKAAQTIKELKDGQKLTLETIDQKLKLEIEKQNGAEKNAVTQLEAGANKSIIQTQETAEAKKNMIDNISQSIIVGIDDSASSVVKTIQNEADPNVSGIKRLVKKTETNLDQIQTTGRAELGKLTKAAEEAITGITTGFHTFAARLEEKVRAASAVTLGAAQTGFTGIMQKRREAAEDCLTELKTELREITAEALAKVDQATDKARQEVRNLTAKFQSEITPATNESIKEAKKPRTDSLESRVAEAAWRAEESWVSGLLRALGDFVVGLVILVVVALVVAAIAAAFGVVLTAWAAVMVAGAILLLVGLGQALYHRFTQKETAKEPIWKKLLLAVSDTVGFTGVYQGIAGKEISTGKDLGESVGERVHEGVLGSVTLASLFLGIRGLRKGPGTGTWTRSSTGWKWVGWRDAIPEGYRGAKSVGIELLNGLRNQGLKVRDIGKWLYEKVKPTKETPETGKTTNDVPAKTEESKPKFKYKYDPSKNLKVLKDAYADPNAVYGYRPRPDGSLKIFADRDWSDPKFVAEARAKRIAYHLENEKAVKEISSLRSQYSDEQVARILVDRRNETRLNSYMQDGKVIDQAGYDQAKQHSKTYEQLRKEGKSDIDIINSSIRGNPGMDACTGLYDDYIDTYIGEK